MSTHSYSAPCPNCDGDMDMCTSTQPFETISGQCLNCGFGFYPYERYMSLRELNEVRADVELPPLHKLPEERTKSNRTESLEICIMLNEGEQAELEETAKRRGISPHDLFARYIEMVEANWYIDLQDAVDAINIYDI